MNTISHTQFTRSTLQQTARNVNSNLGLLNTRLMELQTKMATGKAIIRPSDDPFGAVVALQLQSLLENKAQYQKNVLLARDQLAASDGALGDIGDIIADARSLGLGEIGVTATDETRQAAAIVVDSYLDEILSRGNATFQNRYLFSGTLATTAAFQAVGSDIVFRGNTDGLYTRANETGDIGYSITADGVFGVDSGRIAGFADLNPTLNADTDLRRLNLGRGVHAGGIIIDDGTNTSTIDLSHARTVGDVIDAINAGTPATTTCTLNAAGAGLVLTSSLGGADITIVDASNGTTARDLGIYTPSPGGGDTVTGGDLDPALDLQTPLALLGMGAGIDLASGIAVTNGDYSATLTFDTCTTVEDLLNAINGADVYVQASIADDGRRIELVSLLQGARLRVAETTGTTATDLGIRSFHTSTELSALNDLSGVHTIDGDDFRITCRSGDVIDVDVSDLHTVGDVIDAINNDADNAGKVLARLATTGNGIELVDQTVDTGVTFAVTALDDSRAPGDLGILMSAAPGGDTLTGDDTGGTRNHGVFAHLTDLRDALIRNDNHAITIALQRLEDDFADILNGRAEAGAKGQRMEVLSRRIDQEVLDAKDFLSRTQDLDFATTLVEYSTVQATLEACLQSAATIVRLSLLDFLD